jgi:hypothetical protein
MSHRRQDPRTGELENALRRALLAAAESVEPHADGLDRIRAKVSAGRHRMPRRGNLTVFARAAEAPFRLLAIAVAGLRPILDLVVERFRPSPDGPGRYGWLRPAAALATGLFVVVAGSWAVTDLPQAISPAASNGKGPATIGVSTPTATKPTSPNGPGGVGPGPGGRSRPAGSPTCSSRGAGSRAPTASPTTTTSPTVTASPSQTSTPTVSPSQTSSPSTSPSPTDSPSDSTSTQASPESTPQISYPGPYAATGTGGQQNESDTGGRYLLSPLLTVSPSPTIRPSPKSSPLPCA